MDMSLDEKRKAIAEHEMSTMACIISKLMLDFVGDRISQEEFDETLSKANAKMDELERIINDGREKT